MGGFQGKQLHAQTAKLHLSDKLCRAVLERFQAFIDGLTLTQGDLEALLQTQTSDAKAVLEVFDGDGTGIVDAYPTLSGLILLSDASLRTKASLLFSLFDFDHSLSISRDEFFILASTVMRAFAFLTTTDPIPTSAIREEVEKTFKKVDLSGDKSISLQEFISFVSKNAGMIKLMNGLRLTKESDFRVNFGSEDDPEVDSDLESESTRDYTRSETQEQVKAGKRPKPETQFLAVAPWLGTVLNSVPSAYEFRPGDDEAPNASLDLEYVYGYRCHDVRNNLRYTSSGSIVYHTAAVGIVLDPVSNTQKHFLRHLDDIVAFAQIPGEDLVVTGEVGKTPLICLWNTQTTACIRVYSGVLHMGVSHLAASETYIAAVGADPDHTLAIYTWKSENPAPTHVSRIGKADLFSIAFRPDADNELFVCGVKFFACFEVTDSGVSETRGIGWGKTPGTELQALTALGFIGSTVVTGAVNGRLFIWEGRDLINSVSIHDGAILTIGQRPSDAGIITGGNDGFVHILDSELKTILSFDLKSAKFGSMVPKPKSVCEGLNGRILIGTKGGEIFEAGETEVKTLMRGHFHDELWGLATLSEKGRFFTAGKDGLLALWDAVAMRQVAAIKVGAPANCCDIDYTGTALAVGLESGHVLILDTASFAVKKRISDRTKPISVVKFDPSGVHLAVAAHDSLIFLYKIEDFTLEKKLKGHHSVVIGVDFSAAGTVLQSVSSSYELLYHDLTTGKQDTSGASKNKDETWATWTCTIGWPVQGIWPPFSNGTDINSVRRSNSGKVIVTADDFGKVKLFKYPCIKAGSSYSAYSGHSSHVTNVDFVAGRLISTGGEDKAIFQWKYAEEDVEEYQVAEISTYEGTMRVDLELDLGTSQAVVRKSEEKPLKRKKQAETQSARPWTGDLQASKPELNLPPTFRQHPTQSLTLEKVFGYRGFDSRNNLKVAANGDIVYPAAALGIVQDRKSGRQRFFQMHNDDVVALAIHPNRSVVATGQVTHIGETKTLAIYLWDPVSLATLSCLKGYHTRGVKVLAFSPDGDRLMSVGEDEDHSLAVFDWKSGTLIASSTVDKDVVTGGLFYSQDLAIVIGAKFIKYINMTGSNCVSHKGVLQGKAAAFDPHLCVTAFQDQVLAGTQGGELWVWKDRVLQSVEKKFECPVSALMFDGTRLFVCGADGTLLLLNPDFTTVGQFRVNDFAEFPSIRSIDLDPTDHDVVLLGMKSSEIIELNIGKPTGNIHVLATGHGDGELWGLCAHPASGKVATAGEDKIIVIWNLEKGTEERRSRPQTVAFRAIDWSRDGNLLAVGSVRGVISLFSAENLTVVSSLQSSFQKGDCWIQALKFSPSGRRIAFGAHGYTSPIEIMTVTESTLSSACVINIGLSSALTHLDWSTDGALLMVNSQAYELKFISVESQESVPASSVKETTWASWSCVLGWPVEFIWPEYSDGSDINACARSHSSEVLVTADDFSKVSLFRYPVVFPRQQSVSYLGHSSHVTNVCFTYDDSYLVSIGGLDKCVLVWKTDIVYDPIEEEVPVEIDDINSKG